MKTIIFSLFLIINTLFANELDIHKYTSFLNIELDKTPLNTILKKFGDTKIYKSGDAATSSTRVYYFFKDLNCYVIFDSGEMGGGKIVTSFIFSKNKPNEKFKTIKVNNKTKIWKDLKLDMTKKEFEFLFKDLEKNGKTRIYEKTTVLSTKDKNLLHINPNATIYESEMISIVPTYDKEDKLKKFEIYRTRTY